MQFDKLSNRVIECAIDVHRHLGAGLLESAYERCLAYELECKGIPCAVQVPVPVTYKRVRLECGYRIDMLVDEHLIIELKSVDKLMNIHQAQLLTYMKLAKVNTGLLINFNVQILKDGIKRFVL